MDEKLQEFAREAAYALNWAFDESVLADQYEGKDFYAWGKKSRELCEHALKLCDRNLRAYDRRKAKLAQEAKDNGS
jgi:hypothetical protein